MWKEVFEIWLDWLHLVAFLELKLAETPNLRKSYIKSG